MKYMKQGGFFNVIQLDQGKRAVPGQVCRGVEGHLPQKHFKSSGGSDMVFSTLSMEYFLRQGTF